MGVISKVKNKHSGIKYVISTAKEIGKDYWSSVIAESKFLGLWMKWNNRLTWIRNNEKDAYEVHATLEKTIKNIPEDEWVNHTPNPRPPEGYSIDAQNALQKKLGFIPEETPIDTETVEKIINEFGKVLEKISNMTFGAPESLLPYEKDLIKKAIKLNLDLLDTDDQETRNLLEVGYMHLANFIPDEEAEIASKGQAALMSKDLNHKDLGHTEQAIKISEKISGEQKALLNEIKNYASQKKQQRH